MAELGRLATVLTLAAALGGCGMLRDDGPKVPDPITPAQKAVAAEDNPDSAILAEFNQRLERYITMQRALLRNEPMSEEAAPAEIKARQERFAARLRAIRRNAKQGDIFTPRVARLFTRLINPELKGAEGRETKQALVEEDGEFAEVWLRVNAPWPASEPLTTTPANILANLPQLPRDVEYRVSNTRHLVLRDVDANIIIDFIYNAVR